MAKFVQKIYAIILYVHSHSTHSQVMSKRAVSVHVLAAPVIVTVRAPINNPSYLTGELQGTDG